MCKYKVVGLREEKYIGKEVSGHNCDFTYTDKEFTRHVLLLSGIDEKIELTLWEEQGECGSGWCSATFGQYEWSEVSNFAEKTHTLKEPIYIEVSEDYLSSLEESSFECKIFNFSPDGGDSYYPSGYYSINDEVFTPVGK